MQSHDKAPVLLPHQHGEFDLSRFPTAVRQEGRDAPAGCAALVLGCVGAGGEGCPPASLTKELEVN